MNPFLQPFRAESLGRGVRCSIAQRDGSCGYRSCTPSAALILVGARRHAIQTEDRQALPTPGRSGSGASLAVPAEMVRRVANGNLIFDNVVRVAALANITPEEVINRLTSPEDPHLADAVPRTDAPTALRAAAQQDPEMGGQ